MNDSEKLERDKNKTIDLMRNLVEARQNAGLRQIDVAEAMGTGQPAVSELESGENSPRIETLQRYARAIGAEIIMYIIPDNDEEDIRNG